MLSHLNKKDKRNYLLILVGTAFHFGSISYMFLLPRFIRHIGGNENHIGFIFGIAIIPSLLVSPLGGYLSDKMSGKKLAIMGSAITILSTLSFLFVSDLSQLIYILRILQGSGHALFFAVVFSILSHIIPEKNRAEGIAYFAVCAQIGNSIGAFLAEQIINNLGYNCYFIGSFAMGLMTIGMLSLVAVSRQESDAGIPAEETKITAENDGYFSAILKRNYVSGFLLILVLGGGYGTVIQFVTPYLDYLYRSSLSVQQIPASLFIPPALITVAISRLLLSKITDHWGRNKIILA
ncbi:MAG TPA: MFS transporter, partial [Smithellaceae bacterium]|nr:MFS transporter [Smithellaceae bacterium]